MDYLVNSPAGNMKVSAPDGTDSAAIFSFVRDALDSVANLPNDALVALANKYPAIDQWRMGLGQRTGQLINDPSGFMGAAARDVIPNPKGLLQGLGGLQSPETEQAKQAMMNIGLAGIMDTSGLPNRGRDLIQSEAEKFADRMRGHGFEAGVNHSGSAMGPSSYVSIFDPQTNTFLKNPVRFSGHSKGPFESQGIIDISSSGDLDDVERAALEMRENAFKKRQAQ